MSKRNYQFELDELISKLAADNRKPKLLLHSCCGPCSSYCMSYLRKFFEITVIYYNPNIFPEKEFLHRLSEQKRLIAEMNDEDPDEPVHFLESAYDHDEFLKYAAGLENEREGGARCRKCFELRLSKTASEAQRNGFDYFGTTLTVSPHKNAVILNDVGSNEAAALSVNDEGSPEWLPSDFKKKEGYKQSIELSKKYDLYRQNYCGCEFSIWWENNDTNGSAGV